MYGWEVRWRLFSAEVRESWGEEKKRRYFELPVEGLLPLSKLEVCEIEPLMANIIGSGEEVEDPSGWSSPESLSERGRQGEM